MRYWNQRRASQPFYAFPWPDWYGELEPVAVHHGVEPTSMGFSRSGAGWWFADWMVALTIDDVINVLQPEIRTHRAFHAAAGTSEETRGTRARLVRFRPPAAGGGDWVPEWGNGTRPTPNVLGWREFWDRLQSCGDPEWPQLVQLPQSYLRDYSRAVSHSDIRAMLLRAGEAAGSVEGPLVWLEATNQGEYEVFDPDEQRPQLGPRNLPAERLTALPEPPEVLVTEADTVDTPRRSIGKDEELRLRRPDNDEGASGEFVRDIRQLTFLGAPLIV